MKITDFKKEDLEKGIMIRRKKWSKDISISFNKNASIFDAYINGIITGDKTDLTLEDIISDDWELIEKSTQVWQPQYAEKYYYISTAGNTAHDTFDKSVDKCRLNFGNCFNTREEAQHMVEKIKIINKLRELSNIKFSENKGKYFIYYNFRENRILCSETNFCKLSPFEVCFKTREDCQKAIDTIDEENLKKYYFDVEVEE